MKRLSDFLMLLSVYLAWEIVAFVDSEFLVHE